MGREKVLTGAKVAEDLDEKRYTNVLGSPHRGDTLTI